MPAVVDSNRLIFNNGKGLKLMPPGTVLDAFHRNMAHAVPPCVLLRPLWRFRRIAPGPVGFVSKSEAITQQDSYGG